MLSATLPTLPPQVLDDEGAPKFFEAVRPALEAYEYELDGLEIKPKDNTAMLPRWLAMQEAAAASAQHAV